MGGICVYIKGKKKVKVGSTRKSVLKCGAYVLLVVVVVTFCL